MSVGADVIEKIAADLAVGIRRAGVPIPVGVSHRHFHVTREHWRTLFGDVEPKLYRRIVQPGFWAAHEAVDIEGPKGRLGKVRLVAPYRAKTQVELSRSDAAALGIDAPVRGSGKLEGAAPVRLIGPKGRIDVPDAAIIAQRHLHLAPADSRKLGIADGDFVRIRAGSGGPRETVFEGVLARVSDKFALEFHVDTDEANAAWLKTGDFVNLV